MQGNADKVARQVSDMADNYRQRSPFKRATVQMDMGSPEYQEITEQYDVQVNEMRSKYRSELLPGVVRVRGALADFGMTDAQFDAVYQRPRTFDEMETVALRLWDMTGRLERTTP